ncbi:pantetheine-phosphate adenylyltransferase [Candidatus Williamhamiltonella defendens]|uniref:Phosphopantetheine adenylyltransferase n=1 Tax=Candidatus Hamiltonella defensa (Bemisia tabaci) TaxID=672795 RepID=A0A249DYM9_9ENTR|nr:pantetheine-phosphate adenylyltransferase [Candidatus Hamiltonella defensa]ASX26638.1 pantetheine-phosphate adenylyltransferase [Candidatus Hamiltonella defensa (Bemisia tabaci)]CED78340.1 Phosphopantetheine adenylyltransferase [Candidatus Hamiltonella defensa (Bemisia tabaci)]
MSIRVIYPGTFDPITNGHLDLVSRACALFDHVILAIAESPNKKTLFSLNERVDLAKGATAHLNNIEVTSFHGLLIHFAQQKNIPILLRGIRSFSDFEQEWQLCHMNHRIMPELETLFLMPSEKWSFISSSLVKEIAQYRGDVSAFVPDCVREALLR